MRRARPSSERCAAGRATLNEAPARPVFGVDITLPTRILGPVSVLSQWPRGWRARTAAGLVVGLLLAPLVYALPPFTRPFLWEPGVWGIAVLVAYCGFGWAVSKAAGWARVDVGLQAAWGAALIVVLGGPLLAVGVLVRPVLVAIVVIGNVLAVLAVLAQWRSQAHRAAALRKLVTSDFRIAAPLAAIVAMGVLQYVAALCDLHANPYDDDIAYLPLAKRLLDVGNIDEPFSFRRLSSYGGQTVLIGLDLVRGGFANVHLFDRGQSFLLLLGLLAGYRRGGLRPAGLALLMSVLYLVNQEDMHINTASYFSGAAFFFALYRTQIMALERGTLRSAIPSALLAAGACTLRQNYVPVAALGLVLPYVFAWWDDRNAGASSAQPRKRFAIMPGDRAALFQLISLSAIFVACLIGYWAAAYRSNRTFLFPIILGTFNPAMQLKATVPSVVSELKMQVSVFMETEPLRTLIVIVPAALSFRDRRRGRPLLAFICAAAFGFVFLVHSFSQSDPGNISRYLFGFSAATVMAVFAESASSAHGRSHGSASPRRFMVHGSRLSHFLVWTGLAIQVIWLRPVETPKHLAIFKNIAEAVSYDIPAGTSWPVEADLYRRMQDAAPAGAKLAVLLDEPYHLDFSRQRIGNMDMPGYSSPGPRLPYFQGEDAVRSYLLAEGYTHVAFVRDTFSRYHYRHNYWVERTLVDIELWRIFGPYLLDLMDNLALLAQHHPILFEERGIVLLDLAKGTGNHAP